NHLEPLGDAKDSREPTASHRKELRLRRIGPMLELVEHARRDPHRTSEVVRHASEQVNQRRALVVGRALLAQWSSLPESATSGVSIFAGSSTPTFCITRSIVVASASMSTGFGK